MRNSRGFRALFLFACCLVVLTLVSCSKGQVLTKGNLEVTITRAEWNNVYAGPYKIEGGGLVLALRIRNLGAGDAPSPTLSVRTAAGTTVKQGTTVSRPKGNVTRVETFFLVTKADAPVDLIIGDFEPVRLSPVNKLK